MRIIIIVFVFMLGLASHATGQATSETTSEENAKGVFETIARWGEAVRARNTKTLDEIFENHVVITTFDGKTRGKAEELELLKPDPNYRGLSVKNDDIKVRVFGNAAVATALAKMNYVSGRTVMNTSFRWTGTFVKDNGVWRIVALHTSRPLQ